MTPQRRLRDASVTALGRSYGQQPVGGGMVTTFASGAVTREAPSATSLMFIRDGEPAAAIRLSLLDGFDLRIDGTPVEITPGGQRLLAFLAIQEQPVLAEYVASCLWVDRSSEHALASRRGRLARAATGPIT